MRGAGARAEYSSQDIWQAVCAAVRQVCGTAGVSPAAIAGIGFDATCSLVVRDADGAPLPVGATDGAVRDTIAWLDHRAVEQADRINRGAHPVLRYVGGRISPEMQMPKLLWLKENCPDTFRRAAHFFDLADFLGWRATGSAVRSQCTLTCKWTWLPHARGWDRSFLDSIGLGDLAADGFARIGRSVAMPGTPLGRGLTAGAAADLGLPAGIPVGAGLIDAHAGGLGTVGADGAPERTMAYVFGTSSCTMTSVGEECHVTGIWGSYRDAMVPGMWLLEGGQSAAGAAIDRLLAMHPAFGQATAAAASGGRSLVDFLGERAVQAAESTEAVVRLARGLHVVPDFLGNRAPFADPDRGALIAGLGVADDIDGLVALYVAGLSGLCCGLRQILDAQREQGVAPSRIVVSGGAGGSALVRQMIADVTRLRVYASGSPEPVLLGAAMLGAVAGGGAPSLSAAMGQMSRFGKASEPVTGPLAELHEARFGVFRRLSEVAGCDLLKSS